MDKAVLKTLIYADIFGYPLKAWEVQKWLIGKKATLREVEKILRRLNQASRIKNEGEYYFLAERKGLVKKRVERGKLAKKYLQQIYWLAKILKFIPFVKLVGVSGSLAMENCEKNSDIDLFVVTQKGRIWSCRLLLLILLEALGKRRKRDEKREKVAGKMCINLLLEEDRLAQLDKNIFIAHEILQMRPIVQKSGIYDKFLEENLWVFKFLPNWRSILRGPAASVSLVRPRGTNKSAAVDAREPSSASPLMFVENFVKILQLRYMGKPGGEEKVFENALYFHPKDIKIEVLKKYNDRVKLL